MGKAQASLFLIIAVLLILIGAFVFYLFSQGIGGELNPFFFSRNRVQSYVNGAIDSLLDDALRKLGIQGGYLQIPGTIHFNTSSPTSRLRSQNGTDIPSKEHIEQELAAYIQDNIDRALEDFAPFEERGMEVQIGTPQVDVIVMEQGVIVDLDMPVTVVRGDKTIRITRFKYNKRNVRIPPILSAIRNISRYTDNHPRSVDMTVLDSLDFDFTVVPYNASHFVYLITDQKSVVDNKAYKFRFAMDTTE